MADHHRKIAIIGLGTVGLTLAMAFSRQGRVIGFDCDSSRVAALSAGLDHYAVFSKTDLLVDTIQYSANPAILAKADFFIIAVPTPVDASNEPDLTPVIKASQTVGQYLKKGDIVVYESTYCPGTTEDICIPILEKTAHLKSNQDFHVGYSPERINPGDKAHAIENTVKLISAQNNLARNMISTVYQKIIKEKVHLVSSIKVAEASKVIENIQRDVNIAFINEMAIIMHKMGIDTQEVLDAASTKWSFHYYSPGLVGGSCIGVDPYYLISCATKLGYSPKVISASRYVNNSMGEFIAESTIALLKKQKITIDKANVAILGFSFKEDYPDEKNTHVVDVINILKKHHVNLVIVDPLVKADLVKQHYGFDITPYEKIHDMDALIFAVGHKEFKALSEGAITEKLRNNKGVLIDVKGILRGKHFDLNNIHIWTL